MSFVNKVKTEPLSLAVGQIYQPILLPNGYTVQIKFEGYRTDASIKEKPAYQMLMDGLDQGLIDPQKGVIETSSGNTARSLARLCATLNIPLKLVVDPLVAASNITTMKAFDAEVIQVTEKDPGGGFQKSRLSRVKAECVNVPGLYWINQYDNPSNIKAHMLTTGPEINNTWQDVSRIYCSVGTGGTAVGVGRYFQSIGKSTQVIGCDVVGSVTFGGRAGPRYIPGPGNSIVPGNWDINAVDETLYIPEVKAIIVCRWLAKKYGILVGGSSGLAIAGAIHHLDKNPVIDNEGQIIVIAPDNGEKYLNTIWNNDWIAKRYDIYELS